MVFLVFLAAFFAFITVVITVSAVIHFGFAGWFVFVGFRDSVFIVLVFWFWLVLVGVLARFCFWIHSHVSSKDFIIMTPRVNLDITKDGFG